MRAKHIWWRVCALALVPLQCPSQVPAAADLVLTHGHVWTEDSQHPEAEAVAILGNRILRVGASAEIAALIGPRTRVVELGGRRVLAGFNDAHVHLLGGGLTLSQLDLRDARSQQEMQARVAAFSKRLPPGAWMRGGRWDHEMWSPAVFPTHILIDGATAGHPALLTRFDGHVALANAKALRLAGIDRTTPDPVSGEIVRDEHGEPTGILKDAAMTLVARFVPAPSPRERDEALTAAIAYAHANGVTSVQDMAAPGVTDAADRLQTYGHAPREFRPTLRITMAAGLDDWQASAARAPDTDLLRTRRVKAFADGALGANTAWLSAPYTDAPETSGLASAHLADAPRMLAQLEAADKAGLQIATHAIGDRAVHTMLVLYEQLAAHNGPRDRRLRLEHATMLTADDIARCARQHVIVSTQPMFVGDLGRFVEKRVGVDRAATVLPFRSLLDAGVVLAFGSDWPVEPMKPLLGIYEAVTRRTDDGLQPDGWQPTQKITVAEAVHAYTATAAYAEGQEGIKGSIAQGKLADLVALSDDIFHIAPERIKDVQVDLTIFDGRVVYTRKP